jgi:hypothetical protein
MEEDKTIYINRNHAAKTPVPEAKEEVKKLNKLVIETNRVIYELTQVFPFRLFPDKIIIDENKLTIIRRGLFYKRVTPIPYDRLVTVRVNRSFYFATIDFEVFRFAEDPPPINYLSPKEANAAKSYIMALIQVTQQGIDLSKVPIEETKTKLLQIGSPENEAAHLF